MCSIDNILRMKYRPGISVNNTIVIDAIISYFIEVLHNCFNGVFFMTKYCTHNVNKITKIHLDLRAFSFMHFPPLSVVITHAYLLLYFIVYYSSTNFTYLRYPLVLSQDSQWC